MTNRVVKHWTKVFKRQEKGFWQIPGWKEHQNLLASKNPSCSWMDVFKEEFLLQKIQPGLCLSLGCGLGGFERLIYEKELAVSLEGCDINPYLIEIAQQKANENGFPIQYFLADLNQSNFPQNKYDLIFGAGIFHHVENLEGLFENLKQSLKKTGKLIIYDYVGPSRFQWKGDQISFCNFWLEQLPRKYRKKRGYPWYAIMLKKIFSIIPFIGSSKIERIVRKYGSDYLFARYLQLKCAKLTLDKVEPPPPEQFAVTDPSEAIRSEEILEVLSHHFHVESLMPQGGTLAQPLFSRTVENFIDDTEGEKWASKILEMERELILSGQLSSDFVAVLAKVKD